MNEIEKDLLSRIEVLLDRYRRFVKEAENTPKEDALVYGLRGLVSLANMVMRGAALFGMEPWHVVAKSAPYTGIAEMLLRLRDYKGKAMPPYPFIMTFYEHGFTTELDTILVLAALREFKRNPQERQIAVNVSARSLLDADFVKVVLRHLERLELTKNPDEVIIFEIHESTANLSMSQSVLNLFRQVGCGFAIDDIGLSMNDVMRLTEFEGIADYIKIDRHSVCAKSDSPNSMGKVMSFVETMLPNTTIIAEGAQSALHARDIFQNFPNVTYVQGLYLNDDRKGFQVEYHNAKIMAERQGAG